MGLVVLDEEDLPLILQLSPDDARHPELLMEPQRDSLGEGQEGARECGHVGVENPLELNEGLVVEPDIGEVLRGYAPLSQTVSYGVNGEIEVVFLSGEPLLRSSSQNFSIFQKTRSRIVVEAGYA